MERFLGALHRLPLDFSSGGAAMVCSHQVGLEMETKKAVVREPLFSRVNKAIMW